MYFLITYDISNNKNRTKLSELLDKYGTRVNYSVYECELNKIKLEKLIYEVEIKALVNKKYDSFRFYHIHKSSLSKSFELANKSEPFEAQEMFV